MSDTNTNTNEKTHVNKVKNGISYEQNGWLYVAIKGDPKERGYAYGKLIYKENEKGKRHTGFYYL